MSNSTRSKKVSFTLCDTNYTEVGKWDGDFSIRQLPRGSAIIGRILNITKKETVSLSDACWEVANELYDFWVYIGNVYPKYLLVIKDQINNDYK